MPGVAASSVAIDAALASTADELLCMPDDGMRHELVRGEVRTITPAGAEHGRLAARAARLLDAHVEGNGSGVVFSAETGFVLASDPDTVRAPDAAFVRKKRAEEIGRTEKYWPGAPDFAVEIVSPNDTFHEVQDKALEWLAAGTTAVLVLARPSVRPPSTAPTATLTSTTSRTCLISATPCRASR